MPFPADPRVTKTVHFQAELDGIWQRLPSELLRQIAADAPVVIVKFGMGLLRVPDALNLATPILSYHHGDPEHFRGRPAGFYELLQGRQTMGQVVQVLSNKLDAGKVVGYSETKVHGHSYRQTLIEAYRHSPALLAQAVQNVIEGRVLPVGGRGTNYRLPPNALVLRFCLRLLIRAAKRLVYGAFFEKKWQVGLAPLSVEHLVQSRLPKQRLRIEKTA